MEGAVRKKPLETRERILDAAEDVFNARGVSRTTLNEIAEAAGVTRGAIYWHFKNKVELFEAMCDRVRGPMKALVEKTADKDTEDPLEQLSAGHENLMQGIIDNPHYRKVLNILFHKCEYTDESDAIVIQQKEWQTYCNSMIQNTLSNAQLRKQLPEDLDIGLASRLMGFTFSGLLRSWLFMPDSFDLIEDTKRVNNALFAMLRHNPHLKK
ncbi:TetR family transcriptional regulator [Oxalobacter formigenes]|uniref:Putative multidrug efflux pump transcriptional repressor BpeR n=1 Tax=Oxalobacter formigenes OXCC13 TaxID=556269 RepID=C3X7D2_OXAFO|nr:TetR family transcriptional regulator [Oxalobacter formigenes]ARQ46881.1 HTH-type transcriptional regulator TtgR [Oxalobacter formigenes]ARQ78929.1 TetR family transcriptional regulator [Oxalobacter formigenes OXCC13]EEO29108.1 putative multidrug efflux pump transcriptional repressor BpeR [Oxalobacter formigenes OXCC13]MCZ4063319.1 TetR family transcriptional regulator [Oxalobacter formigenes]QDX32483.1 TetR family transcriptional regulator [Oxalobacter formigenes]